jgi:predicted Zn-dependent protease
LKRLFFIILFLLVGIVPTLAQQKQTDNTYLLAFRYYNDKDYQKAAVSFYKLYRQSHNTSYFNNYLNCLFLSEQYDKAVKEAQKAANENKNNPVFKVYLGNAYLKADQPDKANNIFRKTLKKLPNSVHAYISLANSFLSIRAFDLAEKTYRQGQAKFQKNYSFNSELGYLYYLEHKWNKMVNAYLDLLQISDDYYHNVVSRLLSALYNDTDKEISKTLKNNLLLRLQKRPDETIFNKLLIWLYLQEDDVNNALKQAVALDKRSRNGFSNVLNIGKTALNNQQYTIASKAFKIILDNQKEGRNYMTAKKLYITALYHSLTEKEHIRQSDLVFLKQELEKIIDRHGVNDFSYSSIVNYCNLLGFYLFEPDSAIQFIRTRVDKRHFNAKNFSRLQLLEADLLLAADNPWEAVLLYALVERTNKNNPIGYEAKFKRAKTAYFIGDFKWSEAQLNILKGSTSKLIANDAFFLASLIHETIEKNINDTAALKKYARAEWLEFCNKDSSALLTLDSINIVFPNNQLKDEILYKKATIAIKHKNYNLALSQLDSLISSFPLSSVCDDALMLAAKLENNHLHNPLKAKEYYRKLILEHKNSIFVSEAQTNYLELDKITPPVN